MISRRTDARVAAVGRTPPGRRASITSVLCSPDACAALARAARSRRPARLRPPADRAAVCAGPHRRSVPRADFARLHPRWHGRESRCRPALARRESAARAGPASCSTWCRTGSPRGRRPRASARPVRRTRGHRDPRPRRGHGGSEAARRPSTDRRPMTWWSGGSPPGPKRAWRAFGCSGSRTSRQASSAFSSPPCAAARLQLCCCRLDAGLSREGMAALAGRRLDFVFSSLPWWDFSQRLVLAEADALSRVAPVSPRPKRPSGRACSAHGTIPLSRNRLSPLPVVRRRLGPGWLMPMGFEFGARQPLDPARDAPEDWDPSRRTRRSTCPGHYRGQRRARGQRRRFAQRAPAALRTRRERDRRAAHRRSRSALRAPSHAGPGEYRSATAAHRLRIGPAHRGGRRLPAVHGAAARRTRRARAGRQVSWSPATRRCCMRRAEPPGMRRDRP